MSTARPSFKFRGGSFHALVVRPESPIEAWLADVDVLLARSPGFFAGKSVVIVPAKPPPGGRKAWRGGPPHRLGRNAYVTPE